MQTIFVNRSPEKEAKERKKLEAILKQSWIKPDGTKVSVSFHTLRSNTVFNRYGAQHLSQYQNAANGAISTILASIVLIGSHTVKTVLGDTQVGGLLIVQGYLNGNRLYNQEWYSRVSSDALRGEMNIDDALAKCKRSLEDKMKNLAKGEMGNV